MPTRPLQIAELARGVEFPFPPLADVHKTVLAELLIRAWSDLAANHAIYLLNASETEINALMEARLNSLIHDQSEAWSTLVSCVARGKESHSHDGTHLEKRPDLSLYLTGLHPSFPVAVECKIVDGGSGKTVGLYCDNGVARFVDGEYGWALGNGFMVGYVRDGSTTSDCLHPFLKKSLQDNDPYQVVKLPQIFPTLQNDAACSEHLRTYQYLPEASGETPGPIDLLHIWLTVPASASQE